MKILDPSEVEFTPTQPRTRYPWADWFDGQPREATKGEDFHIAPESFRAGVIQAAQSRNLTVQAKVRGDAVIFQAPLPTPTSETPDSAPTPEAPVNQPEAPASETPAAEPDAGMPQAAVYTA